MSRLVFSSRTYAAIRILVGVVFVVAGAAKLADTQGFARTIDAYGLVPFALVDTVAMGLPLLEVLAGIGLVFDARFSLTAVAAMTVLFLFVLWFGILTDLHIDCGCFSTQELAEQDSLRQAFLRDILLLALCVYLYVWRWRQGRTQPIIHARS